MSNQTMPFIKDWKKTSQFLARMLFVKLIQTLIDIFSLFKVLVENFVYILSIPKTTNTKKTEKGVNETFFFKWESIPATLSL